VGGYRCECYEGYKGDGKVCEGKCFIVYRIAFLCKYEYDLIFNPNNEEFYTSTCRYCPISIVIDI